MRISAVEQRADNKRTPMQFVSDIDDQKPEVRHHAKVVIRGGRSPALKMKMPMHLWASLGSPHYVDIVGTPADGLKIVPGRDTKVQRKVGTARNGKDSITLEISAKKIGVVPAKRPVTQINISYYRKALLLDSLPPEWCEVQPKAPPPQLIEAGKQILPDETPQPEAEPEEPLFAKMAVRKLQREKPYTGIFFSIPTALAAQLGDPQRYIIEGTPYQGFTFKPCEHGQGVKITHFSANHFFIQCGMSGRKIDRKVRMPCQLEAQVKDGAIRIAGACKEWLDASGPYKPPEDKPAPAAFHLSASPTNGAIAAPAPPPSNGNGHHPAPPIANGNGNDISHALDGLPRGNTSIEISAVTSRIHERLADVRALRAELEKRTGLKFKLTSNLTFTLDV